MNKPTLPADNASRTSSRVLELLCALAESGTAKTLRQLTEELGFPRASLHRLLRMMEAQGYLELTREGYRLGVESYTLGRAIVRSAPADTFPGCARPVLEWLANETNETVILGTLSERRQEIVYADVIIADSPLRYAVPTGDRRPLYSSATGKSVLAFLPPEEQADYIESTHFVAITQYTTRKSEIRSILARIRKDGVIHDRDGHFVGAGAVASPVFDRTGNIFASIVVAGPNERLDDRPVPVSDLVKEAGQRISRMMGYEGSYPPE